MIQASRKNRQGFTFVELLAVVLVLAVLAAVAIPIYMNSRRASAARVCKANIATIARAASAYALRNGAYPAAIANLNNVPEGLETDVRCPLTQSNTYTVSGAPDGPFVINCTNDAAHHDATTAPAAEWTKTLPALPAAQEGTL